MIYEPKNPVNKQNNYAGIILAVITLIFVLAAFIIWYVCFSSSENNEKSSQLPRSENEDIFNSNYFDVHKIDKGIVIVIDPGHGGNDPGAIQPGSDLSEAQINRELSALLAAKLMEGQNGFNVIVSDPANEGLSTSGRSKLAMDSGGDLLISLHLNSDKHSSSRGFQVFPPPPGWVYHDESLRFAQLLCRAVEKTQLPLMGENGIYYAFYEPKANGGYHKEMYSSHWYEYLPAKKTETFGVIERSGCPAVLIEQWFISSPEDMELMYNSENMEIMADIIYNSICVYFNIK